MTVLGLRLGASRIGVGRDASPAPTPDPVVPAPAGHGGTPLAHAPVGARVVVTHLHGDEGFRNRLVALGLGPGASVSVTGGSPGRPRVLGLAGCRVAIDDASARRVYVRPSHLAEAADR
jgi:Fe2+ transport system protein FeoA